VFTKYIGVDIQQIALTMLGLVALYLIVKNPAGLNQFVRSVTGAWTTSLVVLQGRNPRTVL
jgi:hypothetical protein